MTVIDTASIQPGGTSVPRFPDNAVAVTKSDTDTFSHPVQIYVGTAGAVTVSPAGGQDDVVFEMPAGSYVPCRVLAVKSTGTDADDMVAVW